MQLSMLAIHVDRLAREDQLPRVHAAPLGLNRLVLHRRQAELGDVGVVRSMVAGPAVVLLRRGDVGVAMHHPDARGAVRAPVRVAEVGDLRRQVGRPDAPERRAQRHVALVLLAAAQHRTLHRSQVAAEDHRADRVLHHAVGQLDDREEGHRREAVRRSRQCGPQGPDDGHGEAVHVRKGGACCGRAPVLARGADDDAGDQTRKGSDHRIEERPQEELPPFEQQPDIGIRKHAGKQKARQAYLHGQSRHRLPLPAIKHALVLELHAHEHEGRDLQYRA
mmetsp:Transcript_80065/g.232463  ORF Transcript_80065/g.232463 Transcript_80065/m.232463 type:complete len:278 (+) Transcript_80065:785-1618(+)